MTDNAIQARRWSLERLDGQRLARQVSLLSMRGLSTVAKLLLAIYTARYLGLSDLGIYGLLAGAAITIPAITGFGMTEWTLRKLVDLPTGKALPLIASRLGLTLSVHLLLQPIAFAVNIALGEPIPMPIALLCGAILLLDNIVTEATDILIARRRILLSYGLTFLQTGVWPIPVMAIGLLYPETRTLEFLLLGWLGSLVVCCLILIGLVLPHGRWRDLRPRRSLILPELPGSLVLYIKDVSTTASMFLDRFIISIFLGLELTGVYTFFWSIANVVHSLAVHGIVEAQLPSLIASGRDANKTEFRALERRLRGEVSIWTLLLTIGAVIATPLLLPFLDRPLMQDYLPVFWVLMLATLLRIAADCCGFLLLALKRDRAIATIAAVGALTSAVLNLVLTPLYGLWGAAIAFALTAAGLFTARFILSRPLTLFTKPPETKGRWSES